MNKTVKKCIFLQKSPFSGLHLAEVGAWWDLSTYKWDGGVQEQGASRALEILICLCARHIYVHFKLCIGDVSGV